MDFLRCAFYPMYMHGRMPKSYFALHANNRDDQNRKTRDTYLTRRAADNASETNGKQDRRADAEILWLRLQGPVSKLPPVWND